ncbi:MAG: TetR/AcrR family transcriptional regulator [Parvularculaceae bacterium]|nr:TetR/AcrR family transcriptional regulator [Amphiplicatus sp.]
MGKSIRKAKTAKPSLSFIEYLETNFQNEPPAQKGARTRERLKIATAKILETKGYHEMRIIDITDSAGLAEGSFYIYFTDKKHASLTALTAFIHDFINYISPTGAVHTPFDSIRAANRRWLALCRANAGLWRCVYQLGDEDADFARLVQETTHSWYLQISENILSELNNADGKSVLLAIYFMGSMMEEIVRKLIIFPDLQFQNLLRSLKAGDDDVADAASLIWMRVFNTGVSLPKGLAPSAANLAQMMGV